MAMNLSKSINAFILVIIIIIIPVENVNDDSKYD